MTRSEKATQFVYQTRGVCPQEIHFKISGKTLQDIRFVGGGCPGNALLVSKLLDGRPIDEVQDILKDIICRNGTSCPDQLALAIQAAEAGSLAPAESFRTLTDPQPHHRVGLVGDIDGDDGTLQPLLKSIARHQTDAVYCIGNLTGNCPGSEKVLQSVRKAGFQSVLGDRDWRYATGNENGGAPPIPLKDRDWLLQQPQAIHFSLAGRRAFAFYGEYVQQMPGYSDFEPFALEINMICGLTCFMSDSAVFPALEAMLPQFNADLVLFGQPRRWGHWTVGAKDFVSVGATCEDRRPSWGLLTSEGESINLNIIQCEDP
jgi:uncharacterized protein (TIGR03905 family)